MFKDRRKDRIFWLTPTPYRILPCLMLFCISCSGPQKGGKTISDIAPSAKYALPGVQGRIDHMTLSGDNHKLYIAAVGNNSVEVLDLLSGKRDTSITELQEPQAVLISEETKRLLITNGGDGKCNFLHCSNLKETAVVDIGDDADNIRYDSVNRIAYVGYGNGAIAILNMNYTRQDGFIPLSAHPEAFELDLASNRIYVNVPQSASIEVIDLDKKAVVETWPVKGAKGNFPMASDFSHHRIFVATRYPSRLFVFDTQTGKNTAVLTCDGDADDLMYDPASHHLYLTCGDGVIDDFSDDPVSGALTLSRKIPTRKGARTALYVPSTHSLYLALPKNSEKEIAEIWVYRF
jgi:DNA-binding beta-propeller fold protein YncE